MKSALSKKSRDILALDPQKRAVAWSAYEDFLGGDKPAGGYDNAKRWYPAQDFECCAYIRSPSRAFPFSLLRHCVSLAHKEALHGADHAAVLVVKRWLEENDLDLVRSPDAARAAFEALERQALVIAATLANPTRVKRARARARL